MAVNNAYSEGAAALAKRRNSSDVSNALDSFEQALKLDPNHVQAWLGKADAHILLIGYGGAKDPPRDLEEAQKALSRAAQFGGADTSAYYYVKGRMILFKDRDVLSARASLAKAVEIDPQNISALHALASTYTFLGQHAEAVEVCQEALSVVLRQGDGKESKKPLLSKVHLAWTYYYAGKYDHAKELCEEILEIDSAHDQANRFLGHIYTQKSDYEAARKRYLRAGADSSADRNFFANYTCMLALAGRHDDARNNIEVLLTSADYVSAYRLAQCYASMGETDKALAQLKRAHEECDIFVLWSAVDPLLSSLKEKAEFRDYLNRIGLGGAIIR